MYDDLLNKEAFLKELKKGGEIDEVKFEHEWEKIKNLFSLSFLQAVMEHMPEEERKHVTTGLDSSNPNDLPNLLKKILDYITVNPEKIDKDSCLRKAVTTTYNHYFGQFVSEEK